MPLFPSMRKTRKDSTQSCSTTTSLSGSPDPTNDPPDNFEEELMNARNVAQSSQSNASVMKASSQNQSNSASAIPYSALQQLVFHCQLAHGSRTGSISGFCNMKQLYEKIAESLSINYTDILFCTLNTHKLDMGRLLNGQIGLSDFIFAHCKGATKQVEVIKSEDFLGLTITDNGNGYAFIKRVKEGSLIDNLSAVKAGDHIVKVNETSMIGCRHFEVARTLKSIPLGSTFTLTITEPLQAGFSYIGPRSSSSGKKAINGSSGRETLRLKKNNRLVMDMGQEQSCQIVVDKINSLLETYMGISDAELAEQIWELGADKGNPHDFVVAVDNSDLEAFGFTDDVIFDLWGAIKDFRDGRLKPKVSLSA